MSRKYVLVTIAFNEEKYIGALLKAVASQTVTPDRWIIISDGSTDQTDSILRAWAAQHSFIRIFRQEKKRDDEGRLEQVTLAKSRGWAAAMAQLRDVPFAYIGNLDADIVFGPEYYGEVINRMEADPSVGLGGGGCYNLGLDGRPSGGGFTKPGFVGGAVQFFRRDCFEDIGGYSSYGHDDVIAVAKAKQAGWSVRCWPEVKAYHWAEVFPRLRDKIAVCFRMGRMDYLMGGTLGFQIVRAAANSLRPPFLPGSAFLVGWVRAWIDRRPVEIPVDLVRFMRADQRGKITARLRPRGH